MGAYGVKCHLYFLNVPFPKNDPLFGGIPSLSVSPLSHSFTLNGWIISGKEESTERHELMSRLSELKEESELVSAELAQYQDCDPDVLNGVKKVGDVAFEAANRWTDNLFQVKSWCRTKFNVEESQLNKQFNIPEDMDYIEE